MHCSFGRYTKHGIFALIIKFNAIHSMYNNKIDLVLMQGPSATWGTLGNHGNQEHSDALCDYARYSERLAFAQPLSQQKTDETQSCRKVFA